MKRLFLRQSSLLHIAIRWVYTVLIIGLTINVLLGVFQAIIANGYAGVPTLDDVRKTFIYHFALSEPILFSILLLLILTIIILGYQADKNLSVKERQVVIESAKKEVLNGLDENIYETLSRGGSSIPEDVALLPHPSIFVGRTDVSSWLMIQLSAVQGAGLFFIQGMEGIGKTALVAQIIKRLSNYYTGGIAVILTMNNYNTRLILLDLISKYVPKKINNIEQMTNSVLRGHL